MALQIEPNKVHRESYARRMGQPTQRATNYTARSNIEPAQICLHANGQSAPRTGGARDVGRGAGRHTPSTVKFCVYIYNDGTIARLEVLFNQRVQFTERRQACNIEAVNP